MTAIAVRPAADTVPHRHLYTRLQHEWVRLCASADSLDRARTWTLPTGSGLGSLDDLLQHTGYGRVGLCTSLHDDVLSALVELAHHDDLAARIVLQRILPGLWSIARRRNRLEHGPDLVDLREQDDDVLSTAWTVIRCFRVDHRRDFVAARMLKEIEYRVFRLPHRRQSSFVPTTTEQLDRPVPDTTLTDPAVLLDIVLRNAAHRGMSSDDVAVLRQWGAGVPATEISAAQDITERTVRNRRWAALRRIQELINDHGPEVADDQGTSRMMSSVSHAR